VIFCCLLLADIIDDDVDDNDDVDDDEDKQQGKDNEAKLQSTARQLFTEFICIC